MYAHMQVTKQPSYSTKIIHVFSDVTCSITIICWGFFWFWRDQCCPTSRAQPHWWVRLNIFAKTKTPAFLVTAHVIAKHQSLEMNSAAIHRAHPQLLPCPRQLRTDEPDAFWAMQDSWACSEGILLVGKREGYISGSRFSTLPGQG